MKRRFLIAFFFYLSRFVFADLYPTYLDHLPDNGIRELASAANVWENYHNKSMEYTINLQTPGYVRRSLSNVRLYDKERDSHVVESVATRKWLDGAPVETNRPLDFALASLQDGGHYAFFTVELPQGIIAYTKDGRFRVDYSGRLVTLSNNFPVLGEDGHIFLPNDHDITVSRSGMLYNYNQAIGKLKIVVFESALEVRKLQSINGVFFILNEEANFKEEEIEYKVLQGYITQANPYKSHDGWMVKNSHKYVYGSLYGIIDVNRKIYTSMSPDQ